VGDLILVSKFHYGIRLPVIDQKIIANHDPVRGDVMVFHYPDNPSVDYIKRVVGVPGDEVSYTYAGKELRLNGEAVPTQPMPDYYDEDNLRYAKQFTEKLGPVEHRILQRMDRGGSLPEPPADAFPHRENCRYDAERVVCKVPQGHYFMMGDNRDDSQDSRYWGFVPDKNIVGKAFLVWMNFHNLKRIGTFH
jgi:signal peptidase I